MLDLSHTDLLVARALGVAERTASQLRSELVQLYGFAGLEVGFQQRGDCLYAAGEVLSGRVLEQLRVRLASALPARVEVATDGVRMQRSGDYRKLESASTLLFRACLGEGQSRLCSVLLPEDGPVELLVEHAGRKLVRGRDATLGWTDDPLARVAPKPRLLPFRDDARLLWAWLEARLNCPYLLGGTTEQGFDCSGLVQRAFSSVCGAVLPRHSRDQLHFGHAREVPKGESSWQFASAGDLLFVRGGAEGPSHVGLVVQAGSASDPTSDPEPIVVHASESRRRVVADPVSRFIAGAACVAWVGMDSLLAGYQAFVGSDSIELSGVDAGAWDVL